MSDLQIGMTPDGTRYVFDREKVDEDVEVYAEDFVCPPGAIEADGFTSAKAAQDYIAKREGRPIRAWKRAPSNVGHDGFEHRLYLDGKHVATVELINEGGPWSASNVSDEFDTLADAKEAADEAK